MDDDRNVTTGEPSISRLVSGILNDAQELFKQNIALLRHEFQQDVEKAKENTLFLLGGTVLLAIGIVFLALTAAYGINYGTGWPLWACDLIVGAVLLILGGAAAGYAYQRMRSGQVISNPSAQALSENVQWLVNRK